MLHASARRVRDLFAGVGFVETAQEVHRGLAPFLVTEGVARPEVEAHPRRPVEVGFGSRLPSSDWSELPAPLNATSSGLPAADNHQAIGGARFL